MRTCKKAAHAMMMAISVKIPPLSSRVLLIKKHNTHAIELLESNKRKNLEDSESSNADCHWKRIKNNSDILEPKIIDIDCATKDPQHTESFAGELELELLNIDDNRGSQGSQRSTVGPDGSVAILSVGEAILKKNSIPAVPNIVPKPTAVAVFDGEKFLFDHQKEFLQRLWMDLREKIANTSIDCMSSLKDDVFLVFNTMKSFNLFDFSGLEELLGSLFDKAAAFDEARSRSSEQATREALAQQLREANSRLDEAKTKEIKEAGQVRSTQKDLERTIKEIGDLKKRRKNLSSSLKRQQQLLSNAQVEVHGIQEEIAAIGDISPLDDEAIKNLNAAMTHLEVAQEDLKNFSPFV